MQCKSKHRLKFTIRGLLVATVFAAVIVGAYVHFNRLQSQRVAMLSRVDDFVTWDVYHLRSEASDVPWWRWMPLRLVGGTPKTAVIYVEFREGSNLADVKGFIELFPEIQTVAFSRWAVNENRIRILESCSMLEEVRILDGPIGSDLSNQIESLPQSPELIFGRK